MSEHAKEPWSVGIVLVDDTFVTAVLDRDGDEICNMGNTPLDEDANASRIASCVNAFPLLYEALEDSQWGGAPAGGQPTCPQCGNQRKNGHTPQCLIGNALRAARGEK